MVRVNLAVTITASGKSLTLMMVYKGKPTGRIQLGLPNYPEGCFYAYQERAWMEESVMLAWIDKVLKPYIETAPIGIHPVILAVTITASGKSLTPMMVYKGKPTGRIQLGLPNYPRVTL